MSEFFALLGAMGKIIAVSGPASIGWIIALLLLWYVLRKREEVEDIVSDSNERLIEAKDRYIEEIQSMNDKLSELNSKHMEIINAVTEARVDDLKELTADYNRLASDTLRTMDRFVVALEVSNGIKKK